MKEVKKFLIKSGFVLALVIFLFSGYSLMSQFLIRREAANEHQKIISIAQNNEETGVTEREFDFDTLLEINDDFIGWLYVGGTNINHPIVQGDDNEFYLTTTFSGNNNPAGAIFMDMRNSSDFSDNQTIIYGHNMLDGTMFHDLTRFQEQSFFNRYSTFTIYTSSGSRKYEIFSAYVISAYTDTYHMALANGEAFASYLEYITELSMIKTGITPTATDKIVSLSTCEYQFEHARMIVHGRLIE